MACEAALQKGLLSFFVSGLDDGCEAGLDSAPIANTSDLKCDPRLKVASEVQRRFMIDGF
jgi:hypothetical protein